MPDTTANLGLPLLLPAQAQKHVTHNEALLLLDILVQARVEDRSRTAPPAAASEGAAHLVAPGGTGAWAGQDGRIAAFLGGAWLFVTPRTGWSLHVAAEDLRITCTGPGVWATPAQMMQLAAGLGIQATPDAVNRLAVSAQATLLTHAGAGHQLKLNKAGSAETVSLLYQSNWSGRAEMGLAGSDDFSLKVSGDGSAWVTALAADRNTGRVRLPAGARLPDGGAGTPALAFDSSPGTGVFRPAADQIGLACAGVTRATLTGTALQVDVPVTGTAVTQSQSDTTTGRLMRVGDFGLGARINHDATQDMNTLAPGFFGNASQSSVPLNAPLSGLNRWAGLGVWAQGTAAPTTAMQIAARTNTAPALFYRRCESTAWQPWVRVYDTANLLGTVSQTAGAPTGAVLERGSNANGDYLRLADGTQICSRTMTASAAAATVWTFPAGFIAAPAVSGSAVAAVLSAFCLEAAPGLSSLSFSLRDKADLRRADSVTLMAVGRWF